MFADWDDGSSISDPGAPAMTLLSMVLSSVAAGICLEERRESWGLVVVEGVTDTCLSQDWVALVTWEPGLAAGTGPETDMTGLLTGARRRAGSDATARHKQDFSLPGPAATGPQLAAEQPPPPATGFPTKLITAAFETKAQENQTQL